MINVKELFILNKKKLCWKNKKLKYNANQKKPYIKKAVILNTQTKYILSDVPSTYS